MSEPAKTYKAAVLTAQGTPPTFTIQSLPLPQPGPHEVLVRLRLTSLCGTDCSQAAGHLGATRPVLGHEGVGEIAALGSHVAALFTSLSSFPSSSSTDTSAPLALGQRVGVAWTRDACGTCAYCTTLHHDGETRCVRRPHSGQACDGTFAQYTLVPARYLLRIPADRFGAVPDELVAPVLCGGVTAYKALKTLGSAAGGGQLSPGQWIAVSGASGGVGAFAVAFGRAMGYRVIAVDAGRDKGEYALQEGAEHYVDITGDEANQQDGGGVASAVKALTGVDKLGVAAVIVCAGAAAAYQSAVEMLAPFGTLMCVGIPPPEGVFSLHPLQFIGGGVRVMGSSVGTRRDTLEALEFVSRGLVTPAVQWAELKDMERLMDHVVAGKVRGKYVINLDKV
ncbi:zinc-binding dehydrogenase [Coniella lustricola]|uniref:Zinc-binding dehydrogenase n=1 Tax=Coniella lustricola TaxID=2025994 RepID=A0A2T3A7D8_9PEZI|nr:zinc-binding dehydrogenase [Coniella lustricola]